MMAAPIPSSMPPTSPLSTASLASLRAAGALVTGSGGRVGSASLTLPLRGTPGEAMAILLRAERVARELGLRHRVEVVAGAATIHLWSEMGR